MVGPELYRGNVILVVNVNCMIEKIMNILEKKARERRGKGVPLSERSERKGGNPQGFPSA